MGQTVSRRRLLQGSVAGAVVLGFDLRTRSWVTEASASPGHAGIPSLVGQLLTDEATKAAFGDDFGHIVHRTPFAVLKPGSVQDIVKMVKFARRHGLKVAMRGHGHSCLGQAQAEGGIIVDSEVLNTIHRIDGDAAVVDPGVSWAQLLAATLAQGLTPPVLTDFQELTVGGTLSVGGLGGTTHRHGLQIDQVLQLQVVTGRGDKVVCSPRVRPDLFNAVLAGLGQCGIIVRATVKLVPAPTHAQAYSLYYDDLDAYVRDQETLLAQRRFEYLQGQVVPNASGSGWRYMVEAVSYFTPPAAPDATALLAGLSDDVASRQVALHTYQAWQHRLDAGLAFLRQVGLWDLPHPWLTVYVPSSRVRDYIAPFIANLTPADTGMGPVLLYPVNTAPMNRPLYPLPAESVAWHLSILRTASDAASLQAMLASNRALYDQARAMGGTRYSIGAIPDFTPADWQSHFGPAWNAFEDAKRRFDPDNILAPGQGIFS